MDGQLVDNWMDVNDQIWDTILGHFKQNWSSGILSHVKTMAHWLEELSIVQIELNFALKVSGIPFHSDSEGAQGCSRVFSKGSLEPYVEAWNIDIVI